MKTRQRLRPRASWRRRTSRHRRAIRRRSQGACPIHITATASNEDPPTIATRWCTSAERGGGSRRRERPETRRELRHPFESPRPPTAKRAPSPASSAASSAHQLHPQQAADPEEGGSLQHQPGHDRRDTGRLGQRRLHVASRGDRQEQEEPDRQEPQDRAGQTRLRRERAHLAGGRPALPERLGEPVEHRRKVAPDAPMQSEDAGDEPNIGKIAMSPPTRPGCRRAVDRAPLRSTDLAQAMNRAAVPTPRPRSRSPATSDRPARSPADTERPRRRAGPREHASLTRARSAARRNVGDSERGEHARPTAPAGPARSHPPTAPSAHGDESPGTVVPRRHRRI